MENPAPNVYRRVTQTIRVVRTEGGRGLAQRLARASYQRLDVAQADFALLRADVADSHGLSLTMPISRPEPGTPLTIGWVMTPPAPGSGGHTTTFRLIEAVERAGHTCVLYLYDRYQGDTAQQEAAIRQHWPVIQGEVRAVRDGIRATDVLVATSWPTAHVVAVHGTAPTCRMYLVQDFEPYFYPRGSEYALAEDTYRFGYRCITIGRALAELLKAKMDIDADVAEFGCDTDIYRLVNHQPRTGVVFYAKPDAARRGFDLGVLALQEFHRRHPEIEIHLFGDASATVPFPATRHGVITPVKLADLYNRCVAGLTLSFTNISLIPYELLACGAIPVINDSPLLRPNLDDEHVAWGAPTPMGLADALSRTVEAPGQIERAEAAAGAVRRDQWAPAQAATVAAIEAEVYGRSQTPLPDRGVALDA